MENTIFNILKAAGVGCRLPQDELFKEGNDYFGSVKAFGVVEIDEEELLHNPFPTFSCHVPGCNITCETVLEYDQHYNSCHRYTCAECKKYLPSMHMLDIHISETHDSFFAVMSEKKPSCYLETCKELFLTPQIRREHMISVHKFPGDFRFDEARKVKPTKKPDENQMDTTPATTSNVKKKKANTSKQPQVNFQFSNSRGRGKRPLFNFAKDLSDSLPK